MSFCSQGGSASRGVCIWGGSASKGGKTPHWIEQDMVNKWVVCILLKFILVNSLNLILPFSFSVNLHRFHIVCNVVKIESCQQPYLHKSNFFLCSVEPVSLNLIALEIINKIFYVVYCVCASLLNDVNMFFSMQTCSSKKLQKNYTNFILKTEKGKSEENFLGKVKTKIVH